jgi:hypothetical protein
MTPPSRAADVPFGAGRVRSFGGIRWRRSGAPPAACGPVLAKARAVESVATTNAMAAVRSQLRARQACWTGRLRGRLPAHPDVVLDFGSGAVYLAVWASSRGACDDDGDA